MCGEKAFALLQASQKPTDGGDGGGKEVHSKQGAGLRLYFVAPNLFFPFLVRTLPPSALLLLAALLHSLFQISPCVGEKEGWPHGRVPRVLGFILLVSDKAGFG